ncbi:hypothetical protein B7L70_10430 [Vulcanisaeta sp. EB80]|nr:hypothetical protein B7L70_10430 [Vulcanisaeta sp. EB80]
MAQLCGPPCEICNKDNLCSECMNKVECSDNVWKVYERLVEDWRRYDAILWQLPFGTMTAVGVILTLAFHYIPSSEYGVRVALFIALAGFTFVMMHVSYKVRHFQIERAACIEAIECKCAKFTIPYNTKGADKLVLCKEIKNYERGVYEMRSYHLVYAMYVGMIYMLLLFAFIELPHVGLIYAAIYACCTTTVLILIIISIEWLQRWLQPHLRRIRLHWRRRGERG